MSNIKNDSELTLIIDNQISEIGRMTIWLDTELKKLGLPSEALFKFDLCANEVVANIITHAFPEGGDHKVTLRLSNDNMKVSLEFEDDGIGFNPIIAPEHVQPTSLEEAKIGGLGVFLTKHYMDECDYVRADGVNRLKITADISVQSDDNGD